MKTYTSYFIGLILYLFSCNQKQEKTNLLSFSPKVVEAHGYLVPNDSMAEPKVILAGKPRVVRAGKPKVVLTNTNVHPAGIPKVIEAGVPKVCIAGRGIYSLPNIVPAIDKPFLAGIPEVVIAKEASSKDQNPQNLSFFGKLQGLNHGIILCLSTDKSGNLWFGSLGGGVSKYDGKSFTHFTEKQGLINNYVRSILEDKVGNLWFGTSGGLSKYDGKRFTNYTEQEGLSNKFILSILEDKSGNLWFGTQGGGVNRYDGKTFTHFTVREGLSYNVVNRILEDKNNNLWFGTNGGGVCKYKLDSIRVNSDLKDLPDGATPPAAAAKTQACFAHFTVKEGLSNNEVVSMLEDKNGNLWFGTNGGGVNKYGPDSIESSAMSFTHYTVKEGLNNNSVWSILEDKNDNLWFGTFGGSGVSKFDGKTFTHFTEKEGLSNNNIRAILEDKSGNIWFGTNGGGLNKYDLSNHKTGDSRFTHFTDKEGLSNNNVRGILEDKKGNLWFGTYGGGVSKYDAAEGGKRFTHFTDKEGLIDNIVSGILEDKKANLWFVTLKGLSKYDRKSFTQFTEKEGLISNDIRSILEDKRGNLWFGSGNDGVCKFDGKTFTYYTVKEGLSNNHVRSILEDKSGNLWFGTANGGVCKFDASGDAGKSFTHFTIKEGLNHNDVSSILEDKNGNLWFGTYGGGVSKFDLAEGGKYFTYFTEREGLSSDIVTSIMEDKKGNIWIGTLRGLNKLIEGRSFDNNNNIDIQTAYKVNFAQNESNSIFKTFAYEDGFSGIGVNHGKTICEARDGTIWIGADDRLTAFHPGEETPDTIVPNIQLTGLSLFNENIAWQNLKGEKDNSAVALVLGNGIKVHDFQFDSTSRWYGIPEHLSLAYDNNYLTFQFVGITLQTPKKVKYQYILEGLDKNWSPLTSRNEATYGNIPNGDYTFKVKSMNGGGYWSKVLSYSFTIRPPWWRTWWAYLFYILTLGFAIWSYIQYRERTLQSQKKVLEKTVSIRTNQLEQKSTELEEKSIVLEQSLSSLKATQAQLIQSEKMASLGELTAGIAHEIQNPLNFVNNFSEINAELVEELKNELHSDNKQEAMTIADEIKQNEQKINLHGKRADAIVKGMLQHSRSSSAIVGVKEPTDINGLAEEYLRLSHQSFLAKDKSFKAELKTDYDESIRSIHIIPQDIGRVLLNLFNNAFWACAERSLGAVNERSKGETVKGEGKYEPTVYVSTKNMGDRVSISVKDNGNGIPQKILDKIFQPFFTTKPTGQGTGLGLSLAYDIVKAHGGTMMASNEGEGAEFIITIPIR